MLSEIKTRQVIAEEKLLSKAEKNISIMPEVEQDVSNLKKKKNGT